MEGGRKSPRQLPNWYFVHIGFKLLKRCRHLLYLLHNPHEATSCCLLRPASPPAFTTCLQAELDRLPPGVPSYLSAAVGSPRTTAARKLCSVCGDLSGYTCTRCGSRYCCRKCYTVHTDTRCLKFMA